MLFIASRVLEHEVDNEGRLRLLERLQERKFTPLIRSMHLSGYEQALLFPHYVKEMERLIAMSVNSEGHTSYVQGDVFCFEDYVLFLLFGDTERGPSVMRAGIVYERQTVEPLRQLGSFCRTLSMCLTGESNDSAESIEDDPVKLMPWRPDPSSIQQAFMRFVGKQDADSLSTIACRENARERVLAAKLLEDDYTRSFMRRAKEAYAEGYPVNLSTEETAKAPPEFALNKLVEGGLLRREVLISCRQSGHMLFSLASADALAVITISHARCSVCGAAIADEKIEDSFAPTPLSNVLLEDGAWLVNRLHTVLRELGVSECEIAVEPPAGNGEARMMVQVCGESFLIVMRDGELTPAFARRAINTKIETEARHLMLVVTGKVHNEGRTMLQGFAGRLARAGHDFELIIAEGMSAAASEIRYAFERVSQKALAEQVCALDASAGLSVAKLINARFQIRRSYEGQNHPAQLPAPDTQVQSLQVRNLSVSTDPLPTLISN
ncbi:MAG TPA: hypothetical protein VF766_11290 [Pyrinomonadaceae bacterium]